MRPQLQRLEQRLAPSAGLVAVSLAAVPSVTVSPSTSTSITPYVGKRNISDDGRYSLMYGGGDGITPGLTSPPTNNGNLLRYDRLTGSILLVNRVPGSELQASDLGGGGATMSKDGRYIAYATMSTNVVLGYQQPINTPQSTQIYHFDCVTGITRLVSRTAADPLRGCKLSAYDPVISDDGAKVLFVSSSSDIVPFTSPGGPLDNLFVSEPANGTVSLVTSNYANPNFPSSQGSVSGAFTPDSQGVVFSVRTETILPGQTERSYNVYHRDLISGATTLLTRPQGSTTTTGIGECLLAGVSGDGRYVAFTTTRAAVTGFVDNNGTNSDLFRVDRVTGEITLISRAAGSAVAGSNGVIQTSHVALSYDGQVVVFSSTATNHVNGVTYLGPTGARQSYVFANSTVTLVSSDAADPTKTANGSSVEPPQISVDGRYVTFVSLGTNVIANYVMNSSSNREYYQLDRQSGVVRQITHRLAGDPAWDGAVPRGIHLSGDGSVAVFSDQFSMQYVPNDFNNNFDVFLWTRDNDQIILLSKNVGQPAVTAGGRSSYPDVSRDGRWMVFASNAVNLRIPARYSRYGDVFLKDMQTGLVTLVSHEAGNPDQPVGGANPVISGDGRYVAYCSQSPRLIAGFVDGNGPGGNYTGADVFLFDRITGTTTLVSHAVGSTTQSANLGSGVMVESDEYLLDIDFIGRRIVYRSQATNLVPNFVDGNSTDSQGLSGNDVYLFDRETGLNTLVSARFDSAVAGGNNDSRRAKISGDGATVVFESASSNLVGPNAGILTYSAYGFDVPTGSRFLISHAAGQPTTNANGFNTLFSVGYVGRYVVHTHTGADVVAGVTDTTGGSDIFLYDKLTGENTLISRSHTDPLLAVGGVLPTVSDDVRYIGFLGFADQLIPGATSTTADLVVYDRIADSFVLASHAAGQPLVGNSHPALNPAISGDGRIITWFSSATNLAPGMTGPYDSSGTYEQVYSFDRVTGAVTLLTRSINNPTQFGNANTYFYTPAINGNGSVIAFRSSASDLILRDSNGFDDVFAYITPPPTITSMKVADGSGQRSVVRSLTVTFDQPVVFAGDPAGAFVVRRGSETVALSAAVTTGTATTVTLTFNGQGTQFGSLVDGRYTLTVLSSQVLGIEALDGDADGLAGGDYVANFHRLFGDSNGDARVDAVDFLAFRLGLGLNNPAFDFDGDGIVGPADLLQFRLRFLKEL